MVLFLNNKIMKIIIALGNPGKKYKCTKKNIGLCDINSFAEKKTLI